MFPTGRISVLLKLDPFASPGLASSLQRLMRMGDKLEGETAEEVCNISP
jgi:hypothetical protein